MIVVDASALLEVLLRTSRAARIEHIVFAPGQTLAAPYLLDIEIAQVIRRYAAKGDLSDEQGGDALADYADIGVQRYPHDILLPRVWALRHNLSAYYATYVALAEALEVSLLTHDKRLAAAAGHRARIELV